MMRGENKGSSVEGQKKTKIGSCDEKKRRTDTQTGARREQNI